MNEVPFCPETEDKGMSSDGFKKRLLEPPCVEKKCCQPEFVLAVD